MVTAARCVLDAGRPRLAEVGLVCAHHRARLGAMLDPDERGQVFTRPGERPTPPSISVLYELLDATPTVGEKLGGGVFRSSPPGDERVMGHRDPRSRLGGTGRDDEQDPPWPVLPTLLAIAVRLDVRDIDGRRERLPGTVRGACSWLYGRLDALCGVGWVDGAVHDVQAVHGQLRARWDRTPPPFGTCRQLVDDEGRLAPDGAWRCATPLYLPSQAPRGADEPVQLPHVRCRGCGWSYSPLDLVRIGREHGLACA